MWRTLLASALGVAALVAAASFADRHYNANKAAPDPQAQTARPSSPTVSFEDLIPAKHADAPITPPPDLVAEPSADALAASHIRVLYLDPQMRFAHLALSGPIDSGDVNVFRWIQARIAQHYLVTDLTLDSPGGDLRAAMEIGRIVRTNWIWTIVSGDSPSASCLSACVFIFAAGAERVADDGSVVGVHRPFYDQVSFAALSPAAAQAKYAELTRMARDYLREMGAADGLADVMFNSPSKDMRHLSYAEMAAFNLVGEDPAYSEWNRARSVKRYGAELMQQEDEWQTRQQQYAQDCVARSQSPDKEAAWVACITAFDKGHPSPIGQSQKPQ